MLTVESAGISKGGRLVVGNRGFTLFDGCILNVHGPNGSGKTSLLEFCKGIDVWDYGKILYRGVDIFDDIECYFRASQYIGHDLGLDEDLTVLDNINLYAALYNGRLLIEAAMHTFGVLHLACEVVGKLSAGQKKRVALSRLLLDRAKIWLLDEPFANLDSEYQNILMQAMKARAGQNGIVVFTSHASIKEEYIMNMELSCS